MDYTVLARRFRPQAFDEVVGQEHVAQALRNAISSDRVAHAYLFTGARGVGKTSTARILAKSLNCPNAVDGNPCNECDVCQAISSGSDMDVLEIDGASNNGVEHIRDLRANVGVRSLRGKYKIYIIDEVHMLSTSAFNALLKTLEEPPPNVKFIFCTTDPQKLPDTILSRCQRFDFGTIATKSIMQRLREIAVAEGVEVDPGAIELVARRAAGSMRDSQSLFDQLLAFGGKQIGPEAVHKLLGTAPDDRLIEFGATLIEKRRGDALALLDTCLAEGVQLTELTDQLVGYLRDLMVTAAGAGGLALLSVADERRPKLETQAKAWGLNNILYALQVFSDAKLKMKNVTYGRALTELALIRISLVEDMESLSQIVQTIKTAKPGGGSARPDTLRPAAPERRTLSSDLRAEVEALKSPPGPVSSPSEPSEEAVPEPEMQGPSVPLEAGRESELLSQIIFRATDPQLSVVQRTLSIAIPGPNQLVMVFPRQYHLAVTSLDRPEMLGQLEKLVQGIVGHPVRVKLRVEESQTPKTAVPAPVTRGPVASRDVEQDPVVSKLVTVFGAQIVRVDAAETTAAETAEATGSQDAE